MRFEDLLGKAIGEMNDEELQAHLHSLQGLKMRKAKNKPKSNKEKRTNNLLDNLSKEDIAALIAKLKEKGAQPA